MTDLKQTDLMELMLSAGDTHANLLAEQEKEKVRTMTAISGQRCYGYFKISNKTANKSLGAFSKMFMVIFPWASTKCLLTWKPLATQAKHTVYQLVPQTYSTGETGYGLLPTPVASDGGAGAIISDKDTYYTTSTDMPRKVNQHGTDGSVGLARLVQMWPTPRASSSMSANLSENRTNDKNPNLEKVVASVLWATPTAHTSKQNGNPSDFRRNSNLTADANRASGCSVEKAKPLNPNWVEWLMGFPQDWTHEKKKPQQTLQVNIDPAELGVMERVAKRNKTTAKRLKCLGNAVVPQIPEIIGNIIMEIENGKK